jgi:hypothetical protein
VRTSKLDQTESRLISRDNNASFLLPLCCHPRARNSKVIKNVTKTQFPASQFLLSQSGGIRSSPNCSAASLTDNMILPTSDKFLRQNGLIGSLPGSSTTSLNTPDERMHSGSNKHPLLELNVRCTQYS